MSNFRWISAGILWLLGLSVLLFNIRRHKLNNDFKKKGVKKNVSGIPFLFTIFTFIGLAASPLNFHSLWWSAIIFELPALVNFVTNEERPSEEDTRNIPKE